MAKRMHVCRNCKRFTMEGSCPYCKSTNLSSSWKGMAIVLDTNSEVAKALKATEAGKYALYVD